MRQMLLVLLAAAMLSGCAGLGSGERSPGITVQDIPIIPEIPEIPKPPDTVPQAEDCSPSYSFSELKEGTLSRSANIVATATCAAGKQISVSLDGKVVRTVGVDSNEATPLVLEFAPVKDGTVRVEVRSGDETVFSRDWSVKPLGSDDTDGLEKDGVSFKEWRAVAVDVENAISPGRVRVFMKRMASTMQPTTEIVVEIRDDSNNNPGTVLASVKRPFSVVTQSDNWISFDFDPKPALAPGRYWIVFRVDQTDDVVLVSDVTYIHYVTADKHAPGNDYTRVMRLSVDDKTGFASETSWQPLPFDKVYSVILTSG